MVALRQRLEEHDNHLSEANRLIHEVTDELLKLIPDSVKVFAKHLRWYEGGLRVLVHDMHRAKHGSPKPTHHCLSDHPATLKNAHGFETIADLRAGMQALEEAWQGAIRISVHEETFADGNYIRIHFGLAK